MKTAYTKSDRATGWAIFGLIAVCLTLFIAAVAVSGCTAEQLRQIGQDHPGLAPTTQATERGLEVTDHAAVATAAAAGAVAEAAHVADSAGVPYAKLIELLAAGVAGVATLYTGHRMGTNTLSKGAKELTGSGNGTS